MKSIRNQWLVAIGVGVLWSCGAGTKVVKQEPVAGIPVVQELSADESFALGLKAFQAGQFNEAQGRFRYALERNPKLVAAQYNLGVVGERLGNLTNAEQEYEAALKVDARHLPSILGLGKIYRQTDNFEKAIGLYERALKEAGWEFEIALLNNLSAVYRLAKKFDLAEATARKVLSRSKDNAEAYKNLALIYFDQGNFRLAEFIIGNIRKLDDKDPGVYNNLGMIYLKFEDHRLALAQFQKAIALDPNFVPGHMNLGALALSYRDYESAEKSFAKVVALDPNNYEGHLAYAYALDGQRTKSPKKGLEAASEFEKVLNLKTNYAPAICGAGWAYSSDKTGYSKALTYLNQCKAISGTPEQEQVLLDGKIKGLTAMLNSGAPAQPVVQEREKPKGNSTGSAGLLDKVAEDAANSETTSEEGVSPSKADEQKK